MTPAPGVPEREIKIECRDLELLHRFLREVLGSASHESVVNTRAVNGDACLRKESAGNGYPRIIVGSYPGLVTDCTLTAGSSCASSRKLLPFSGRFRIAV